MPGRRGDQTGERECGDHARREGTGDADGPAASRSVAIAPPRWGRSSRSASSGSAKVSGSVYRFRAKVGPTSGAFDVRVGSVRVGHVNLHAAHAGWRWVTVTTTKTHTGKLVLRSTSSRWSAIDAAVVY